MNFIHKGSNPLRCHVPAKLHERKGREAEDEAKRSEGAVALHELVEIVKWNPQVTI